MTWISLIQDFLGLVIHTKIQLLRVQGQAGTI